MMIKRMTTTKIMNSYCYYYFYFCFNYCYYFKCYGYNNNK